MDLAKTADTMQTADNKENFSRDQRARPSKEPDEKPVRRRGCVAWRAEGLPAIPPGGGLPPDYNFLWKKDWHEQRPARLTLWADGGER